MNVEIPYGKDGAICATIMGGHCLGTLDVADRPALADPAGALHSGLDQPIGMDRPMLAGIRPGDTVGITISDQFRVTAIDQLLPTLIDRLNRAGVPDSDIRFIVATGTHRPPMPDEQRQILGPAVFDRFRGRIVNHDPHDDAQLVSVGTTPRGTPVFINRHAVEVDRLIVTGACVLHYFGGFGGGRKGIVPGLAGVRTIAHNHAMNLDPHSDDLNPAVRIGVMDGNPVAEDMRDAARLAPVTGLINTVLNRDGDIAGLFVGDLEKAHAEAAEFARSLFAVSIDDQADLVIASSGGTRNFVQTHKALYNAWQAMRPGGRIVLACQCAEGLGGVQFVKWLRLGTRPAVIAGLREQSEINGQTALSTLEKAPQALFVTDLPETDVAAMGGRKAPDLQTAINTAFAELHGDATRYYVMPSAAYTVPFPIERGAEVERAPDLSAVP